MKNLCKFTVKSPAASYIPLPRFLLLDEELQGISNDAKVLYALLLDRASISRQNGYIDPDGTIRLYFTVEQVQKKLHRSRQCATRIRLMLGTGMRSQELLALEPRHIEPDGSVIHIEQAINMQKGTATIGVPKSRDSYRNIPVPKSLRYCAVALRETGRKYIWEARKVDQPCNPTYFRDQFRKALEAIPEVRLLTPHSCRHTYVSQMQALGVDLSTIQSIVGHADVSMTQHYLHVQESIRMDAVDRFSKAFPTGHSDPDGPDEPSCKVLKFPNVG